jgi:hypothetical protein
MGVTQAFLVRVENNVLNGMDIYYAWEMAYENSELVAGREKKKRKTRNEVCKGSDKSDEAEDSNNLELNKPANIARSD